MKHKQLLFIFTKLWLVQGQIMKPYAICMPFDIVNLLSSAPGTVSHLQCSTLGYESCEMWVMLKKLKDL